MKKVVFPVKILPIVVWGSTIQQLLIGVFILVAVLALMDGVFTWLWSSIPLIYAPFFIVWALAALGVFLRGPASINSVRSYGGLISKPCVLSDGSFTRRTASS